MTPDPDHTQAEGPILTETAARPREVPAPVSDQPPPGCPFPRSLSYITGEYSIKLDYAGLTGLMDEVTDLWDRVEAEGTTEVIGDGFGDLLANIARLRDWTGWGVSAPEVIDDRPPHARGGPGS
jgi:hypothetical protein